MPKLTVEYEIPENGDCFQCGYSITDNLHRLYCKAFDELLNKRCDYAPEQCQSCKDFLAKEASKVYCDGCIHHDSIGSFCWEFTDRITLRDGNRDYSLNCKQKETE